MTWAVVGMASAAVAIGIAEMDGNLGLTVFPNPASTVLFLGNASGKPMDVVVYEVLGHEVLKQENTTRLDIAHLLPGSYLLVITQGEQAAVARLRFIKQ